MFIVFTPFQNRQRFQVVCVFIEWDERWHQRVTAKSWAPAGNRKLLPRLNRAEMSYSSQVHNTVQNQSCCLEKFASINEIASSRVCSTPSSCASSTAWR